MVIFKKFLSFVFSIYAFLIFIGLMLILFPFIILASFFGKIRGGNLIYNICRLWTDIALFIWGIRHTNIYESPLQKKQAVIFVFNHISYMDIPFLMKAFRRQAIRILGKYEMARIPVFGFIYRKAVILVNRENDEARLHSVQEMKKMLAKNISIVIAPEGTFNTTHQPLKEFYNGAFKIAVETGTPIRPVIFLDSYDRLNYHSVFSLTPGKSRAVFLAEISPGNDAGLLKQKVFDEMKTSLLKYKASWIKNEDEG